MQPLNTLSCPSSGRAVLLARLTLLVAVLFAPCLLSAEVGLSPLFSDHVVLQRGKPVVVWGDAEPGERVTISFRGASAATQGDAAHRWRAVLPAGDAGGPFELLVEGSNRVQVDDVWVGDVWVASGQSNMELALRDTQDGAASAAAATLPAVRVFRVQHRPLEYPSARLDAKEVVPWQVCAPETAGAFSGVAFHFARELQQREKVPIGVIEAFWGGTPAEAWTSLDAISAEPDLMPVFAYRAQVAAGQEAFRAGQLRAEEDYARAVAAGRAQGLVNPAWQWHPDFAAWSPGALFNGMIAPVSSFPIRGVIWYQGESNSEPLQFPIYEKLFSTLIGSWRRAWSDPELPFLYVQIANWAGQPPEWHWPEVREAQRRALAVPGTAMVVSIDVGDARDIHPKNKRAVGERLALAARALSYGESVEWSGPLVRAARGAGHRIVLEFAHATGGLAGRPDGTVSLEVAGEDRHYTKVTGRIEKESVVLDVGDAGAIAWVRYAWEGNPAAELKNGEGLPASPFVLPVSW